MLGGPAGRELVALGRVLPLSAYLGLGFPVCRMQLRACWIWNPTATQLRPTDPPPLVPT